MVKNPLQYLCSMPQCCHTHIHTHKKPPINPCVCCQDSIWTDCLYPPWSDAVELVTLSQHNVAPVCRTLDAKSRTCCVSLWHHRFLLGVGPYSADCLCLFRDPGQPRLLSLGISILEAFSLMIYLKNRRQKTHSSEMLNIFLRACLIKKRRLEACVIN